MELLLFQVDEKKCALPLDQVIRVELAASLSPLPGSPDVVAGCLNYRGEVLPVMRVGERLGIDKKDMDPEDRLIVARCGKRELILWVNSVSAATRDSAINTMQLPGEAQPMDGLAGVSQIDGHVILIHDLERFLSTQEETQLESALRNKKGEPA